MKLAILADIHGNLPAFEAVLAHVEAWRPDQVVVAGDVVNRGPRPLECWRIVQEKQHSEDWLVLYGNHEEYVLNWARPDAIPSGPYAEVFRGAQWTLEQLDGEIDAIDALPFQHSLTAPDGSEVRAVHASMLGTSAGIFPKTSDDEVRRRMQPAPQLFCVAHTHRPLIRQVDGTLVVNAGAVGLPFDGDARACYAQLTWRRDHWHAVIVRLEYDRALTERDFFDTGFLPDSGPLAELILVELREARSQLYQWTNEYEARVVAGDISLEESVARFLEK